MVKFMKKSSNGARGPSTQAGLVSYSGENRHAFVRLTPESVIFIAFSIGFVVLLLNFFA